MSETQDLKILSLMKKMFQYDQVLKKKNEEIQAASVTISQLQASSLQDLRV
jgi:hypothetical protein